MKFKIFLKLIIISIFFGCDAGFGTSGRDHCKNYAPVSLNGPIRRSKAERFRECMELINITVQRTDYERYRESFDLYLLGCSWRFKKLKECDNESLLPNPIPIKY